MSQKTEFFFGITHPGKVRGNNEDAFVVQKILKDRYVLACVIDGVGGYEGGEIAAHIARETILDHLQKPSEDLFIAMKESLVIANEKIYNEKMASERNNRMACVLTVAVADLVYNQFYYAHVGDTRLYLLRDYTLVKITRDDSFVGFLEDSKRLSEEEAMKHPKRNEINKALGFDPNIGVISDYIETGISPFLPGDILLICSDGLTDMIDSKAITSILTARQEIPQKTKALVTAANDAGGKDNVTVVLVHNINKPVVQKVTRPPVVKKNELQSQNDEKKKFSVQSGERNKRSSTAIVLLSILCIGLVATLLWQFLQNRIEKPALQPVTPKNRNAAEQNLQDIIQASSFLVLNDSAYGKSILISDTINLQNDSLHLNGNGIALIGDSQYKGPAIVIGASCQYILLENLVFENFQKVIVAENRTVHLKNVLFRNCDVPLQYQFLFPENKLITGKVSDTMTFVSDSLLK